MMPKRPMPSRDEMLGKMQELGTQSLVASYYGCHRSLVQQWMSIHKIRAKDYRTGHSTYKKLEASDIPLIRELTGMITRKDIAEKFGVKPRTIYDVVIGKTWGWVD